jgi:hypothetical protein
MNAVLQKTWPMSEHIILLHGIWMRGITLHPLARRLRGAGYEVETLDYASVSGGIEPAVARVGGGARCARVAARSHRLSRTAAARQRRGARVGQCAGWALVDGT